MDMPIPYDEGFTAAEKKESKHSNPYKSPNAAKTDDVKSESWLRGYEQQVYMRHSN